MPDELLQGPASSEVQQEEPGRIDAELEQVRARVAELEALLAEKEEEVAEANARISELEGSLAEAVSGYRALAVETNPQVLEELITGASIEEINASLDKAIALVNRVKQELEAEIASARVPAGAPERAPINLEGLSPREKIQYAIGGRR